MLPQYADTSFYFTGPSVQGLVALTIDDGICRGTATQSMLPEVLSLLRSHRARATFFLSSLQMCGG